MASRLFGREADYRMWPRRGLLSESLGETALPARPIRAFGERIGGDALIERFQQRQQVTNETRDPHQGTCVA